MAAEQRKEPLFAAGQAHGEIHQANIQTGDRRHQGLQQCVGQRPPVFPHALRRAANGRSFTARRTRPKADLAT